MTNEPTTSAPNATPTPKPKRPWWRRWLRRLAKTVALLIGLLVVALGGYYAKWEFIDHRMATITEGSVYQSAAIPADEIVAVLQEKGIRTVIDVRDSEPDLVAAEHEVVEAAGLEHVHIPMPQDPDMGHVKQFLDTIEHCPLPVLVHCTHGQARSVLMCAIYRIEDEGWSIADAFQGTTRLPDLLKPIAEVFPSLRRFKADSGKGRFLLDYKPLQR
ncbi:MAG: dual specificity protein phosphatase family protein [Planctomycetes bacterium]|nr:dual specificity protein phosphatase family protein [Planctomycetota bacterium]